MPHVPSKASVEFSGNEVWRGRDTFGELPVGFAVASGNRPPLPSAGHDVGCRLDSVTKRLPQSPCVFPPMPPPDETGDVYEDFESLAPGAECPGWICYPASTSLVCVVDGVARAGKRSLCVKDDGKPGYRPFLEAHPHRTSGMLRVSFDLLAERGARPRVMPRLAS